MTGAAGGVVSLETNWLSEAGAPPATPAKGRKEEVLLEVGGGVGTAFAPSF